MTTPSRFIGNPWQAAGVRERVRDHIVAIENKTGAEVVVTVGAHSGLYRDADALSGALCSLGALLVYYFHPAPLPDDLSLAIAILCYPAGSLLSAAISPLRRLLVRNRRFRDNVLREGRSRFVEQGISNTKGRTGVLVYISCFERCAQVVADSGIPVQSMGASWRASIDAIQAAVRKGDVSAFLTALDGMGDVLAGAVPRRADDTNELPDEVRS